MSTNYKTERIEDIGLRAYLDKTKEQHNNFGYEEFATMITVEVNKSNIARAFGVNRETVRRWIRIKEREEND